jgi:acetylornithine deacetylase/succinyl-diaminopimelate desuccinylase-like protein
MFIATQRQIADLPPVRQSVHSASVGVFTAVSGRAMPFDSVATLRDLVAIPSINPMGRAVAGPEFFEYRVTDYLEKLFARLGIPTVRQPIALLRENLIARLDGNPSPEQGGSVILLEAHQDTVPVEGMTIPPFAANVENGRVYGRGACDIKGGMTSLLAVMARLAAERANLQNKQSPSPTVFMACTVNEEHGFTGALGLCRLWETADSIFPIKPHAAIVAEPTQLQVIVAHKGAVRWRLHMQGRSSHSSAPEKGANAIFRMAKVLNVLECYQNEIVGGLATHPLCGKATLSVGTITGGISVNTVPDRATIEIDRRLVPGEDPVRARQHVIDFIAQETGLAEHIEHAEPYMKNGGLNDARNGALADQLVAAVRTLGIASQTCGVAFGTDAACYDAVGVPTVVFGPGSIEQAHTADEWVPLVEVDQASEAIYRFIADFSVAPSRD